MANDLNIEQSNDMFYKYYKRREWQDSRGAIEKLHLGQHVTGLGVSVSVQQGCVVEADKVLRCLRKLQEIVDC